MSTWFANARRRLKKENKMTWEPKNKLDDEDVDVSDDEDKDNSFCRDEKSGNKHQPSHLDTFLWLSGRNSRNKILRCWELKYIQSVHSLNLTISSQTCSRLSTD